MTAIGAIGSRGLARVGWHGGIAPADRDWRLEWWIGADDRWRLPERETAVRQRLVDDTPVVETAMRVPGGDAVHRAYGVGDGSIALEVENASPAPFVVAFVVRGARLVALRDETVLVDGRPTLVFARRPSRWAAGTDGRVDMTVVTGQAAEGPFPSMRHRAGRIEAAFLHPVAHRSTLRAALVLDRLDDAFDLRRLASPDDVTRGWVAQLRRGMQVDLPDERLAGSVRAARAALLLDASARRPRAGMVAALEDWGFDREAAEAWERLPARGRRAAAMRADRPPTWPEVERALEREPVELLLTLRAALVHERDDGVVTLLADPPEAWRGRPLEVHDAPTRRGPVSFAVRWHGERPALLWDAPPGTQLRAPGLDPEWESTEGNGETLLASSTP